MASDQVGHGALPTALLAIVAMKYAKGGGGEWDMNVFLIVLWCLMRASSFFLAGLTIVQGCSDFLLNATSQVVSARTMDFFVDLRTVLEIVPRDTLVQESIVKGCPDCADNAWRTKYGFVALNSFGFNIAADGLNEKGLSAATLFLPGSQYPTPNATDAKTHPMVTSLVTYILGNYANVEEVKAGLLHDIQIVEGDPGLQVVADPHAAVREKSYPLHFPVHDAAGKSIVVELLNGTVNVYDNPAGVLTNEPPFLEQLALVAAHDKAHGTLDKTFLGGYTPVERFQRLTFLNRHANAKFIPNTTYSTATPDQAAISQAVHMISTVRIPTAYIKDGEATEYTLVRDHQNRRLFFQSNENQVLRRVDLDKIDFTNASNRRAINVTYGDWSVDVTDVLLHSTASTIDMPSRSTIERLIHASSPAVAITGTVADSELHHASFWMGLGVGVGGSAMVAAFVAARVYGRQAHDYVRLP